MIKQQVAGRILFICIFHFMLVQRHHCAGKQQFRLNNHDPTNSNGGAQDPNSDSTDGSYDLASPSGPGETEPDDGGLPPPNELSVIRLNDTSVVLRWELSEGVQDRLQFFKIQYRSAKRNSEWKTENKEIPATTRAYQINGLKPGNIFFAVIAVYDNDDNVTSEQFKFRLRSRSKIQADEMPELKAPVIHWREAKSDYFRFKWSYLPKAKDVEWFGYLVYYRSAHVVSDFTIYNTLDESVEIAEVEPDTPYQAKVVAYNQNGISEFSDTITIRTEPKPTNSTLVPIPTTTTSSPTMATTQKPMTTSYFEEATFAPAATTTTTSLPPYHQTNPKFVDIDLNNDKKNSTNVIYNPPHVSINNLKNTNSSDSNTTYNTVKGFIVQLLGDHNDGSNLIQYWPIIFCPIIAVVFILFVLLSRHRGNKKESPNPSV